MYIIFKLVNLFLTKVPVKNLETAIGERDHK